MKRIIIITALAMALLVACQATEQETPTPTPIPSTPQPVIVEPTATPTEERPLRAIQETPTPTPTRTRTPTPEPTVTPTPTIESEPRVHMFDITANVIEKNHAFWRYEWRAELRSYSKIPQSVDITVHLTDQYQHIIASFTKNVVIEPKAREVYTGDLTIDMPIAQTVNGVDAYIEIVESD